MGCFRLVKQRHSTSQYCNASQRSTTARHDPQHPAVTLCSGRPAPYVEVEAGATCVNVLVRGLDKAEGVRWLARETGITLHAMAGVGDATGDISFMQLVGWSAAPANAQASVKQMAHYTSPYENGRGLMDILTKMPLAQEGL
jgi:3-deoxy-D-manno-octulosonate 8-phosphate phosphatase (KDO 8-P phosphatase)